MQGPRVARRKSLRVAGMERPAELMRPAPLTPRREQPATGCCASRHLTSALSDTRRGDHRRVVTHSLDLAAGNRRIRACAVKCGGYSSAGFSTCDGGMMIDLSGMNAVRVD